MAMGMKVENSELLRMQVTKFGLTNKDPTDINMICE